MSGPVTITGNEARYSGACHVSHGIVEIVLSVLCGETYTLFVLEKTLICIFPVTIASPFRRCDPERGHRHRAGRG